MRHQEQIGYSDDFHQTRSEAQFREMINLLNGLIHQIDHFTTTHESSTNKYLTFSKLRHDAADWVEVLSSYTEESTQYLVLNQHKITVLVDAISETLTVNDHLDKRGKQSSLLQILGFFKK